MKTLVVKTLPCLFISMLMMSSVLSRRLAVVNKTGEINYFSVLGVRLNWAGVGLSVHLTVDGIK